MRLIEIKEMEKIFPSLASGSYLQWLAHTAENCMENRESHTMYVNQIWVKQLYYECGLGFYTMPH